MRVLGRGWVDMPRSDSGYSRCVSARGHGHLVGFGGNRIDLGGLTELFGTQYVRELGSAAGDVDAYPAQRGVHTVALAPLTNMHWAVANSEQPTHGTDASPSCEQLSRLTRLLIRCSVYQAHTRVLKVRFMGVGVAAGIVTVRPVSLERRSAPRARRMA